MADQAGVNVAVMADSARPAALLKALAGKGKRLGIGIDTGLWAQEGVAPAERSRAREGAAAVSQAAGPFRARRGRPKRAARPGRRRSERVVPGNGAPRDQARLDDARHHRGRQRSRRSVQGHRRLRSRRAAGVRDQLHGLLEDASDPVGRRDAGEGGDAESRRAPQGRRRGAREDRRRNSEAGLRGAEEAPQAARHREPPRDVAQHDSAHQRDDRGDGEDHRGVGGRIQQRPGQSEVSEDQGVRRRVPEQHRRGAPARSGRARGARAVREGRGRAWRHSRHAVGVAQLGRVRGDDRRAERAAPDRAGRDEGLRRRQPAHEAVRRQGSAVSRGVLPLRARGPGAAAVGQRARPADRRARRPEDRAAPVERLQASRQHLSRSRGFAPTARDASSTTRSATCRRRS